tara:strand:- start:1541 stop:1885 length:345 start_codon:yes stop_codon:yes gene_type:complete
MKISFREYDEGLKNKVYVNNRLIGYVKVDIWNQKWKMYPNFNFDPRRQSLLYTEYDSFYKAGKAMVNLFNGTLEAFKNIDEDDTDEFDMRGFINQQVPKKKRSKYYINLNKPKP